MRSRYRVVPSKSHYLAAIKRKPLARSSISLTTAPFVNTPIPAIKHDSQQSLPLYKRNKFDIASLNKNIATPILPNIPKMSLRRFYATGGKVMDEEVSDLKLDIPVDKPPDVPFTQLVVPLPENRKITTITYYPHLSAFASVAGAPLPTLFFVPGVEADEARFTSNICQYLCTRALCQVIFINLRLAEPQSGEKDRDAYEAMKFFITTSPHHQSIDKDRIVIGGSGSGNKIAASMAVQALNDNIPILGQVLLSSNFSSLRFPDMSENNISEKEVELFLNSLSHNRNSGDSALLSFWNKKAKSQKLPPTTILLTKYDGFGNHSNATAGGHNQADLLHKSEVVRKITDDILRPMFEDASGSHSSNHRLVFIQPKPVIKDASRPKL